MTTTVYLLHFERPYKHARHYVGGTRRDDVEDRIAEHRTGKGARLMQVVTAAGIGFVIARVWKDMPDGYERKVKRTWGGIRRLCPLCQLEPL